jgi:HlyD family secretion protein
LQVGQTAEIVFPAISIDNTYSGVVESVSPDSIANSSTVSYKVVVKPTEMPDSLKLGMSANVEIVTARVENVLSVPESYVVEKDDKFFLKFVEWKDDTKTAYDIVEKEVTIGLVTDEYTEIKSGAKEGDEIVEPSFEPQRLNLFGAP